MSDIEKLLKKPKFPDLNKQKGRFEKFNLKENPFPSNPIVNKDADDARINGQIFEMSIREKEYEQIKNNFLKIPQSDLNHLRLGYIVDTSYIGRGNGKSAFLINLQKKINHDFCLKISEGMNKCFSIFTTPEPSGRTKTFDKLVDSIFSAILKSDIIKNCLATLVLEAILELKPDFKIVEHFKTSDELIIKLNSPDWFKESKFNLADIYPLVSKNDFIKMLPDSFPLRYTEMTLLPYLVTQKDFEEYYNQLKKSQEKLTFVFSYLVDFFRAANFNGAYIFIDDFERIPDFQSARQKRDFAIELRSCLFDGLYTNAKIGFYNFFLVLHAGAPRLIQDAWSDSGMENRAPIAPPGSSKHIVPFKKLTIEHAVLLVKKYLSEYRIDSTSKEKNGLYPFEPSAIDKIAETSELNAAKILKAAYEILDSVSLDSKIEIIDEAFVSSFLRGGNLIEDKPLQSISSTGTIDLFKKAKGEE